MRKRKEKEKGKKDFNMLDSVTMAPSVQPASAAQGEAESLAAHSVEEVGNAVEAFLKKLPDVREVSVVKLVSIDPEKGTWEAEAEVYTPNKAIRALGLPVQREVLDCRDYLLRVDGQLKIIAYGPKDSVGER